METNFDWVTQYLTDWIYKSFDLRQAIMLGFDMSKRTDENVAEAIKQTFAEYMADEEFVHPELEEILIHAIAHADFNKLVGVFWDAVEDKSWEDEEED